MGMGGGKKITVTTYTYRCRFAVAISFGPIDEFVRLDYNSDFKDYDVERSSGDSFSFDVGDSVLYGTFHFGTETQGSDSSLAVMHGGETLSYRRIAYASFWCDLGQSPSMPATAFTLCRYYCPLSGIDPYNTFESSLGLNPAQVLYDLISNRFYGFGLKDDVIDVDSFRDAGARLYNEGIGVGIALSGGELYNVMRSILDWIDGELVYDEPSGSIKLVLKRPDWVYETLPEVFESDMKAQSFELDRISWYATKNVIYVNFMDIARECDQNSAYTEDLGNFNITGNYRVQEFNFDIFTNMATAQIVSNRLLHKHSYPLAKVIFECFGKTGDNLAIYEPFRLYHSYYGVWGKVYRVVEKRREGPNLWKIEATEEQSPPDSLLVASGDIPYNPPYWTQTLVVWNYRFVETYYRGVLFLGYSDDQTSSLTTLDCFGVQTDYGANEIVYACVGRLMTEVAPSGSANLYIVPDKNFVTDDPASLEYVLIDDEIMKISDCSVSTDEIYYYCAEGDRALEGTFLPGDNYSVGTKVYAIECRAFIADNLQPGATYNFTMIPHYTYPQPYFYPDDLKTTILTYQGLILKPEQPGAIHVNDSNPFHDNTFTWTRQSRIYPQPVPCDGLTSYPMEGTDPSNMQDQILGWKLCLTLPPGITSLFTAYTDPATMSYVSKYIDRAAAGISTNYGVQVYARGVKGYDSPYSFYHIT